MSRIGNYHTTLTGFEPVLKYEHFICVKDFYSLNGELIFMEGETYKANNDSCIISGSYNLHVTDNFYEHFRLINRTKQI